MTQTKIKKVDRAALLRRLKELHERNKRALALADVTRAEIYITAYLLLEAMMAEETLGHIAAAQRIALQVKRHRSTVSFWYCCGKIMRKEGIDWRKCRPGGVTALTHVNGQISDADRRDCVRIIRNGGSPGAVRSRLSKSSHVRLVQAERKAAKLERAKRLTPTTLKMEMLALQTLAKRLYGKEISVALYDGGEEVLAVE